MDDNDKCRTLVSPPPIASNLQEAKEMLARYGVCIWRALNDKSEGRVKDQRKATVDNSSSINEVLQHAVTQLGGKARSHYTASSGQTDDSQAEGLIWDISPRCCSSARSHDAKAFPMHTDASFKTDPPTHFLLFVLSQDVLGGGLSSILSGGMLLRVLSPAARMLLSRPTFTFQIPEEFRCKEGNCPEQGPSFVSQSILMTPSYRWRFRSDIVSGPNPHVIRHLDELLRNPSLSVQMRLIPGSALLMDNGLFFHARSNVLDSERWLKRMQFYLPNVEDK